MNSVPNANESFREAFRETIPKGYSGVRHGGIVVLTAVIVIGACLAAFRTPVQWWEIAMAIPVLLVWNIAEWHGHRLLHRPGTTALSKALYTRHTLTHHKFFTHQNTTLRDSRDLKIVFFPAFALPAIALMAAVPAAIVWLILSLNAGLVVLMTVVALYLLFEIFHLCAHLPEGSWITRVPIISTMRRHHQAHHNPELMMKQNMNFTLPWSDWFFKTSDLDRGLWGTTFNGSSTRHERPRK